MILLRLNGEIVVEVVKMTSPYTPKENEVMVDTLPQVTLSNDEIGRLFYRNGSVVVEKEKR